MGEGSDGLAAIFPAMLNAVDRAGGVGLRGRRIPFSRRRRRISRICSSMTPNDFRIQPCFSPVWDTAINAIALAGERPGRRPSRAASRRVPGSIPRKSACGATGSSRTRITRPVAGRSSSTTSTIPTPTTRRWCSWPSGSSSPRMRPPRTRRSNARWTGSLSFQCRDGGWGAFDKDVMKGWLEDIPFADHNAMLDPSCSDLTGPHARIARLPRLGPPRTACAARHRPTEERPSATTVRGTAGGASITSTGRGRYSVASRPSTTT